MSVLAARESFAVEPPPRSDCGSLLPAVDALRAAGVSVRAMRDATRGGVAAVLHEWSEACGQTLAIDEAAIPLSGEVRGLCEILGLDPLFVANEGTMLAAVGPDDVDQALAALRSASISAQAVCIGSVSARTISPVTIRRALGRAQPLDEPLAALLPRIC
jgi:hydrogenase expression/formation protein HypE